MCDAEIVGVDVQQAALDVGRRQAAIVEVAAVQMRQLATFRRASAGVLEHVKNLLTETT
jgi:methylase of polypeptide subunit release factors